MTTLDIGSIVSVRATIAPSGTPREEFGRTLLLTADNALPVSARLRNFANLVEVAEVFPPDSEPYRAARVYFSQSPYPAKPAHRTLGRVRQPLPSPGWNATALGANNGGAHRCAGHRRRGVNVLVPWRRHRADRGKPSLFRDVPRTRHRSHRHGSGG